MRTRRSLMVAAALAVPSLASLRTALAQPTAEQLKTADFLFVQTARGMTFDKTANTVTLGGVSPVTVFFSDRPERIAGNMKTAAFIPLWAKGKDSFKSDPPNADISLLEGDKLTQIVAELQDPVLNGEDLTYTVKILKGDMPTRGGEVSVFIDIFGRPLTPISFAGIARRRFRRAFLY